METIYEGPKRKRPAREETDDDVPDFIAKKARSTQKLKSAFESIFEKYGQDFTGVGDEIDLETGEIVVNNGHVQGLEQELDNGEDDILASPQAPKRRGRRPAWSMWTPRLERDQHLAGSPVASSKMQDLPSDEEDDDEPEFQQELLHQIRNHGDRQREDSIRASDAEGKGLCEVDRGNTTADDRVPAPDDNEVDGAEHATTQSGSGDNYEGGDGLESTPTHGPVFRYKEGGIGWTDEETERLIQLRKRGIIFSEMPPYFIGKKKSTLRDKWNRLVKLNPELQEGPGDLLDKALSEIAAGRLRTDRGVPRKFPGRPGRQFTRTEDERLIHLRRQGLSYREMLPRFSQRREETLQRRFRRLAQVHPELQELTGHLSMQDAMHPHEEDIPSGDDGDVDMPNESPARKGRPRTQRGVWSREEDALILQLHSKGVRFEDMSPYVRGRGHISVRKRFKILTTGDNQVLPPKVVTVADNTHREGENRRKSAWGHIETLSSDQPDGTSHVTRSSHSRGSSSGSIVAQRQSGPNTRRLPPEMLMLPETPLVDADDDGDHDGLYPEAPEASSGAPQLSMRQARLDPSREIASIAKLGRDKPKKPRGRPRKAEPEMPMVDIEDLQSKRSRGRLRKSHLPTPQTSASDNDWFTRKPEVQRQSYASDPKVPVHAVRSAASYAARSHELAYSDQHLDSHSYPARPASSGRDDDAGRRNEESDSFAGSNAAKLPPTFLLDDLGQDRGIAVMAADDDLPLFVTDDELPLSVTDEDELGTPIQQGVTFSIIPPPRSLERTRFNDPIQNTDHETSLSALPSSFEARQPQSKPEIVVIPDSPAVSSDGKDDDTIRERDHGSATADRMSEEDDGSDAEDDAEDEEAHEQAGLDKEDVSSNEQVLKTMSTSSKAWRKSRRRMKRGKVLMPRRRAGAKPSSAQWSLQAKPVAEEHPMRGSFGSSTTDRGDNDKEDTSPKGAEKGRIKPGASTAATGAAKRGNHDTSRRLSGLRHVQKQYSLPVTPQAFKSGPSLARRLSMRTPLRGILQRAGFRSDDSSEDELCTPGRTVGSKS